MDNPYVPPPPLSDDGLPSRTADSFDTAGNNTGKLFVGLWLLVVALWILVFLPLLIFA